MTTTAQTAISPAISFSLKHPSIRKLYEYTRPLADLRAINQLLGWDQQTQMPKGANAVRGQQRATLAAAIHAREAAPQFGRLIAKAEAALNAGPEQFTDADRGLAREARRAFDHAVKLPEAFVRDLSVATATAFGSWQQAKQAKDYRLFVDDLARVVDLTRQKAHYLNPDVPAYEVLFDLFEPGMPLSVAVAALEQTRDATVALLKKVKAAPPIDGSFLKGQYDHDQQIRLSHEFLKVLNYDFNHGRLDLSAHPFTSGIGAPYDSRVTTRVREDDVVASIMPTMHECGHALHGQGIDPALSRTLLGKSPSSAIGESQSRSWENIIGRSLPFWQAHYHVLQRAFPRPFKDIPVERFLRAINRAEAGFIRVEADELTYNLHIIIRFEIERMLFEGGLEVNDLPGVWNQKYQDYLGITPPDDALGVMQDVHWSEGLFGYFPTYALGNLYSAQFAHTLRSAHPDMDERLAQGETLFVREWQREHIHRWGTVYQGYELGKRVNGVPLNPDFFIRYITAKVTQLYGLR